MMDIGGWIELTWALTLGCLAFIHLALPLLGLWPARRRPLCTDPGASEIETSEAVRRSPQADETKHCTEPVAPADAPRTITLDGELALAHRMAAWRRRAGLPPTPSSIRVLQAGHRLRRGSPMAWSAGFGDRQKIAALGGSLPRGEDTASSLAVDRPMDSVFSGTRRPGTSFEPSAAGAAR